MITKQQEENKNELAHVSNLLNFVTDAKNKAKNHWEDSKDAWTEYLASRPRAQTASSVATVRTRNRLPIFWASVKNLLPAYYSRTPNTVAKRLFDSQDPTGKVSAQLVERLSKTLLHKSPLTEAMTHASVDFVLTDKATAKMHCEEVYGEKQVPVILNQDTQEYMTNDGQVVTGQVTQNEDGSLMGTIEGLIDYKIEILPLDYDDVIHTPNARNWSEISQIGLRLYLTKAEFLDRFGSEKLALVTFGAIKDEDGDKSIPQQTDNKEADTVELWEIWDKRKKMVSVVSQNCKTNIIDEYPDPYELKGFFPIAPFVISTKPSKNLYPTPMYVQLKPLIVQLHRVFDRICKMTSALRRRGIADAQLSAAIEQLSTGDDLEIVAVKNFQAILERGGLEKSLLWFPLQELSNALSEAVGMIATFEDFFNKLSGVPDVVRGSTNPNETASAQQQKGEFYNLRTSWDQLQFQEMARILIEMQVEIALKKFPEIDGLLEKYMGVQFLDPADQPYVPDAIKVLLSDQEMDIRVEIETDSMSYMNDKQNQEQRAASGQIVIQGLQQIATAENPAMITPIVQVLFATLRAQSMGKDFENTVAEALKKMEEAAQTPPPPPPVDPNVELNQAKIQVENGKLQLEYQKFQAEREDKMMSSQLEQMQTGMEAQMEARRQDLQEFKAQLLAQNDEHARQLAELRLQLDSQVAVTKLGIDTQKVQIDGMAVQNEMQQADTELTTEAQLAQMETALKAQEFQLKGAELELEANAQNQNSQERIIEEQRLARQQTIDVAEMAKQSEMQDKQIALSLATMQHEDRQSTKQMEVIKKKGKKKND